MIPALRHRAEDAHALGHHFRTDAIARQQRNRQRVHTRLECVDS